MKICHIADIHIRSQTRIEEYRKVFSDLADDIKRRGGVDAIFVGGDIWHAGVSELW